MTATAAPDSAFASRDAVRDGLRRVRYLADERIAGVVQCYEGLDESKALYEWNYKKQLLRIQARQVAEDGGAHWSEIEEDIFSEDFLLTRPLLEAIRSVEPIVLLIDEVDRVEVETEALLLEVLSDYQVSIPELGTVRARGTPLVFLTSNNTRELSEALKRRCLYLHMDYPDLNREKEIVLARVPDIAEHLAGELVRVVRSIRTLDLKKHPSVSETLDWARTLVLLGVEHVGAELVRETLHVLAQAPERHRQGGHGALREPDHATRWARVTSQPSDVVRRSSA
jgi:MoxR-like ATPase